MSSNPDNDLRAIKKKAAAAAKDMFYGADVIVAIKNAKSEAEISRIMQRARHERFK